MSEPDLCYGMCGQLPEWEVTYRTPGVDYSDRGDAPIAVGPASQLLCSNCLDHQLLKEGSLGTNITVEPFVGCQHDWHVESDQAHNDKWKVVERRCLKCRTFSRGYHPVT